MGRTSPRRSTSSTPTRAAWPCRPRCCCSSRRSRENKPLFTLDPALVVSGYWTSAIPQGYSNTVQILASGKVPGCARAGRIGHGAGLLRRDAAALVFDQVFELRPATSTPQDDHAPSIGAAWKRASSRRDLEPGLVGHLQRAHRADGQHLGRLCQDARQRGPYLGHLGENVTDVSQLWPFAVMQADGLLPTPLLDGATDLSVAVPGALSLDFGRVYQEPIDARDTLGPLGYGWTDNWQYSLSVASDGTVTVTMPSGARAHLPARQPWQRLLRSAGRSRHPHSRRAATFTLQETDGQIEPFNADGTLDYIQDTNGNRITAGLHQRPAHQPHRHLRRVADDRLQRGRPDRVGHQLRRPHGPLHLRRRRAPDLRAELRRHGDPVHLRRRLEPGDRERADARSSSPTARPSSSPTTPTAGWRRRPDDRRRRSPDLLLQRRRGDRHRRRRRRQPVLLQSERADRQDRSTRWATPRSPPTTTSSTSPASPGPPA